MSLLRHRVERFPTAVEIVPSEVPVGRRRVVDRPLQVETPDDAGRGEIELPAQRIDDLGIARSVTPSASTRKLTGSATPIA